ncbi:MAG TPA: hypothetical protein PKO09_12460 [Anaerolineae bacterium]|nr:hypothetical protein [Anaerolineae bacterium]
MDPLERARRLREEADTVMREIGVGEVLRPYGGFVPTGSYFLDVMAFPDIDLYMRKVDLSEVFAIGGLLARSPLVFQVVVEKDYLQTMAGGLYLKPRFRYGDWGRPWKIDIWSMDDTAIEERMAPMYGFREKMTPALREAILRYKNSILTPELRTPTYSGYYVYCAFLDEGLSEPEDVTRYLVEHGIRM